MKPKNLSFWVGNDSGFQGAIQTPDKKTIELLPEVILQFFMVLPCTEESSIYPTDECPFERRVE